MSEKKKERSVIQKFASDFFYGEGSHTKVDAGQCVRCDQKADKDSMTDIEKREYTLSGFCKVCQHEIFDGVDNGE